MYRDRKTCYGYVGAFGRTSALSPNLLATLVASLQCFEVVAAVVMLAYKQVSDEGSIK